MNDLRNTLKNSNAKGRRPIRLICLTSTEKS